MFFLNRMDFFNAPRVPPAFELTAEERFYHLARFPRPGDPLAQADNLRVIMQPTVLRRKIALARRCADARHLIRRNRNANA